MRLSLHEVLAIVGRLDDGPGFDTPRERFRRFLVEHMTTPTVARTFLDEAQQLISEQYQRALQDTVASAGHLLGFEVAFTHYERHGAAARPAGRWLSRRRLVVDVDVWTDDAASDESAVARSLDSLLREGDPGTPHTRLSVVAPSCGSRPRIEDAITARHRLTRVVSVRSLMDLISVVASGHVTHDDVLRLLHPTPALEGAIGLLARMVHNSREATPARGGATHEIAVRPTAYWIYVAREREGGAPAGIGTADVLQIALPPGEVPSLAADDRLAFFVPSRGVVAQAEVATVGQGDASRVSDDQIRFPVHLRDIVIFDTPRAVETEQRLNLELQAAVSDEPCVRVGMEEFEALTLGRRSQTPEADVTASG